MGKKVVWVALFVLLAFCINSVLFAQEGAENAVAKLNSLRREIKQVKYDYQQEADKVTKAADDKLVVIKADFHKVRNECLQDKKIKLDKLRADYEAKMKPMQQEEKRLLELGLPGQASNFAKTRTYVK